WTHLADPFPVFQSGEIPDGEAPIAGMGPSPYGHGREPNAVPKRNFDSATVSTNPWLRTKQKTHTNYESFDPKSKARWRSTTRQFVPRSGNLYRIVWPEPVLRLDGAAGRTAFPFIWRAIGPRTFSSAGMHRQRL